MHGEREDLDTIVRKQITACESIGTYLEGRSLIIDTHLQQILAGTAARAKETFRSMCALASEHQTVQAAMLCRSIFEDMVVTHWLVLHEDEPEFLTNRYIDHLDAIRLNEARTTKRHGYPAADVSDLAGREDDLVREFGANAQRQWWAVRDDGRPINMPEVIEILEQSTRFGTRMKGEKPILREMFEKAQKWNNQLLHHTPEGMPVRLNRDEPMRPLAAPTPQVPRVLIPAYWSYGQIVYLVLDVIPEQDWRPFEPIFLRGLVEAFGAPIPPDAYGGD
ncbi:MAG TPA: DUF5677 domain-containing protein [Solirubrobacterales bacterium]|jgi:hypothetical protein|nr:DUF5677 domain-containing protein [Solirubrobacterales bacterium]